jgi:hypothetical protein
MWFTPNITLFANLLQRGSNSLLNKDLPIPASIKNS